MASHSQSASLLSIVHSDSEDEDQEKYLKFKESYLRKRYKIQSLSIFKVDPSQGKSNLDEQPEEEPIEEIEHNRISELIHNPGLAFLAKKIFEFCDLKTLKVCRQVYFSWKELIDANGLYYPKQIELLQSDILSFQALHDLPLKGGMDLSKCEPWTQIINRFKKESLHNMKSFIGHMIKHYETPERPTFRLHPLNYTFIDCNVGFLSLILPPDSSKVLIDECHQFRIEMKYKKDCTVMILQRFEKLN